LVVAGGDLVAAGEPAPGEPWRIGIRHPDRPDRVVAVLRARDLAVATSGHYERGEHIRDARTGLVATGLRSVTVIGPALALADAYATAAFAMGEPGLAWVARQAGFGAVWVTAADRLVWTPVADGLLDREPPVS
jgi:thiamine biosynthesis lipoprotein